MKKLSLEKLNEVVNYEVLMNEKGLVESINGGEVIGFCKSEEKWGLFGNMSGVGLNELKVKVEGGELINVSCSESLFVCMKFNNLLIENELKGKSGFTCKLSSKKYKNEVLGNFEENRIEIMRWVLRVKLFYNMNSFGKLLLESGEKEICEVSNYMFERKNNNGKLWGVCKYKEGGILNRKGSNWLGKLLVELREELKENNGVFNKVEKIEGYFCGKKIEELVRESV